MKKQWYALRSKPNRERNLEKWLNDVQVDCWLPAIRVKPTNPRAAKIRPYFPGYLFVYIDLDEIGENRLNWAYGAHGLVTLGDAPTPVPDSLIRDLQRHLDSLNIRGGLVLPDVKPGDRVRITEGPMRGYEAIFDSRLNGRQRVQILLTLLSHGAPQRLRVSPDILEKIR
jgi:transcriptional antiterminator RfaH